MARIRSLKIGFFRSERLAAFSPWHRLLFEGLWLLADREGLLEDRPRKIKAELFPYDDVDVEAMLVDLAAGKTPRIRRYQVNGDRYIAVLKFHKHQRPNRHEPESTFPLPEQAEPETTEPLGDVHAHASTDMAGRKGKEGNDLGKGKEGKGEGETRLTPRPPSPNEFAEAWNRETAEPIPRCLELTDKRKVAAKARLRERPLEAWIGVMRRIQASDFCRGENDRAWVASFDWILQPDVAAKVLEGKYDNRARAPAKVIAVGKGEQSRQAMQRVVQRIAGDG